MMERCSLDIASVSSELPFRDEWREDPLAMKAEVDFMQTATLLEMESRSWYRHGEKLEGVYTIKSYEGQGYTFPPEMSEPFVSERNEMWCVYITHMRFRNRAVLTLDIGGNIVERNITRIIALGNN